MLVVEDDEASAKIVRQSLRGEDLEIDVAGADGIIQKPLKPAGFRARVRELVESSKRIGRWLDS